MESSDRLTMEEGICARIRELLPLEASGALSVEEGREVAEHLAGCELCREEAALVALLRRARPGTPDILLPLILKRVEGARRLRRQRVWGLRAAAAAVVVALGAGIAWNNARSPGTDVWALALHPEPVAVSWSGGEWMAAGAPVFDDLPDEVLLALLNEGVGP